MKLYFIRHGESIANRERFYGGQSDVPLTDVGKEQARELIPFLEGIEFDRVFSSDLSRAMDTQKIALPVSEVKRTSLLREIDVGLLVGKPFGTKIPGNAEKPGDYPGGEKRSDVQARLIRFLDEIKNEPWERVAIFTHNGILNSMLRHTLGENDPRAGGTNRNCAALVFEWDGKQFHYLEDESRK
jgi:broad specificity phosphatase PhoE